MITTSAWVPRGFAAPFPSKYNFDDAEFERIAELAKLQLDDANEDLDDAREGREGREDDEDSASEGDNADVDKKDVATSSKTNKSEMYAL